MKVKFVTQTKDGLYRYNRRVPADCQKALRGKKLWNLSLGKDSESAIDLARDYRKEHDRLIARLRDPDTADLAYTELVVDRTRARFEAIHKTGTAPVQEQSYGEFVQDLWRKVPAMVETAEADANPERRKAQLSIALGTAYSDRVDPPNRKADRMMYDAYRVMLEERLDELEPCANGGDPEMRVSALLERYIRVQALRPNTARSYRQMVESLTENFGDHPLPHYDRDKLKLHRDRLEASPTISAQSVEKHFAPLKALWRWAADEYDELANLQIPRVRLSKRQTTVEESRWQALNDAEITTVWKLLNEAWGPESISRMSLPRRKSFLMAVRVLLYTGLRPAEVFRLTAADVEDGILTIRRTKTTARKLPISVHIADFPAFLAVGGFEQEQKSKTIAVTLSDNFRSVIRAGGIENDRHVLYSLKDTLVDRLQRQKGMSDDVIRGIIGHVSGQGKLRHYKTPLGDTPHGRAAMKAALDAISYW